jgi:hypothetical protein
MFDIYSLITKVLANSNNQATITQTYPDPTKSVHVDFFSFFINSRQDNKIKSIE